MHYVVQGIRNSRLTVILAKMLLFRSYADLVDILEASQNEITVLNSNAMLWVEKGRSILFNRELENDTIIKHIK